jgi:hypothetical protein
VSNRRQHNKHFLAREADGSVRLRIRFETEEASLFEEAAGDTPIMVWIHRTLGEAARRQVKAARAKRPKVAPPTDE